MLTKTRFTLFTITIAFVFLMSAIYTIPAYADDESPPVEPIATAEPSEPPAHDPVIEEASFDSAQDQTPPASDSVSEEIPPSESADPILTDVPEGTEVVLINEEGETVPLATEEAAEIIATGDPIWCPANVAMPIANTNGCSGSYTTFAALLADPIFGSGGPAKDGVIWIEGSFVGGYNGNDNATITINGSTLTVMKDFKLTLKGGWNGAGTNTIDTSSPSIFDVPILIINWNNDVTLSNITISGANGANALEVQTTKNITLTNVQSNNNATGRGAYLHNNSGAGNVTVTNAQFTGNSGAHGLFIESNGIITLKDITANSNNDGYGAYLDNDSASVAKAVILSGTNTFNYNGGNTGTSGLYVTSLGLITVNNLIATENGKVGTGGAGVELYNNNGSSTSGVTLTGTNTFSDNVGNGLTIITFGAIKGSHIYANSNGGIGAFLFNSGAVTSQAVILTGSNEFKYNGSLGLSISSRGQITLNSVSANSNGNVGAALNNVASSTKAGVTLTGTNSFSDNFYTGINIQSTGIVTMNNITVDRNGASNALGYGASISNTTGVNFTGVTLTGINSFSDNYEDGLVIFSSGVITLNNITASDNDLNNGTRLDNTSSGIGAPKAIILNGTNVFNNNAQDGLAISSYGPITTNNITANDNGQGASIGSGVNINSTGGTVGQIVAIKGTNNFNDNLDSGLYIQSGGAISTNAITANDNDDYGVYLLNTSGAATSTVTMTGTNLITVNDNTNLFIQSVGAIIINNLTASDSVTGNGAQISNTAGVAKPVTLTGANTFNDNSGHGLFITSNGLITLNTLTANNNGAGGGNGGSLDNSGSSTKAGVILNGTNQFNGNSGAGLSIFSLGLVKVNSITASSNGSYGAVIDVTTAGAIGGIAFTGTNTFSGNTGDNLNLTAVGAITLNAITSTGSVSGNGAAINNIASGTATPKAVTLTGTNIFSNNNGSGVGISSYGVITINNTTASNNGSFGGYLSNSGAVTPAGVNVLGTNLFNTNTLGGLYIESKGLLKTNNITASNSTSGFGASFFNTPGTAGVTMTGINTFNNNSTSGLQVSSNGVITVSNLTASFTTNGFGASFNNLGTGFAAPKAITLSGSNNFNSNNTSGLLIDTYGAVTINNLTASYNGLGLSTGMGADIDNNAASATIASIVTLTGNNSFIDNFQQGLNIESFGAIKINNLTASLNGNPGGAILDNQSAPTNAFGVTLSGKNIFNNNTGNGLTIDSKGAVLINAIAATFNTGNGADIDNTHAGNLLPKPVTLTGTNVFSDNVSNGLLINTNGLVTASNVTASNNTGALGVSVDNSGAAAPAGVNFTGTNIFNNNINGNGLLINSHGKIALNNITTNNNLFSGLDIINNGAALTSGVTLTGINTFNNNSDNGMTIVSTGAVNITKITADENAQSGIVVSTMGAVTITCGSFNMNNWYGWEISNTTSLLTLKGVFTAGNTLGDFQNNALSTITTRSCPLP